MLNNVQYACFAISLKVPTVCRPTARARIVWERMNGTITHNMANDASKRKGRGGGGLRCHALIWQSLDSELSVCDVHKWDTL